MLTLYEGDRHIPVLWTHLIPATFEGKAKFNVENALAAAGIAFALGSTLEHIRQGLRTFTTSFFQAPGRCNVFDEHPFRVIVDYGHNPAAMAQMCELVRGLAQAPGKPKKRAIGVVMAAGDRRDDDIREVGKIAASAFDIIIAKEDDDLRGRAPGEVPRLVGEGARAAGLGERATYARGAEPEAVDFALGLAEPGDLVVVFADDVTRTWKQVIYWGKPVEARGDLEATT